MTYCIAMNLEEGMIFASDSRTNAGVDDIGTFGKLRTFAQDGDRVIVTLSAGNLSVTQNALNLLDHRARHDPQRPGLMNVDSMFEVATMIGDAMREIRARDDAYLRGTKIDPTASFIVGGQIKGEVPRLFLVYSEGNFIESSPQTPFFQTGETKFGKPILAHVVTPQTTLAEATKCALVSFDSTMRSNVSVGPPIDLQAYRLDSLRSDPPHKLGDEDPYLQTIRRRWNQHLREGIASLPGPDWM